MTLHVDSSKIILVMSRKNEDEKCEIGLKLTIHGCRGWLCGSGFLMYF